MQRRYDIDDYNEGVAYVAAFFTVIYFIPKIAPFINILQGIKNFEDTPGFQITVTYINAASWFLYGDLLFSDQMKTGYMIACFICLISMGIYLIYEIRKYFLDTVLNILILVFSSWGAYRYFTIDFDDDVFLGIICIVTSFFVYLFNIYNIYRVIKAKNFALIPINITVIHLLAALCWYVYGIIDKDHYIYIPYGFGVFLNIVEIVIYRKYKKGYPSIGEKSFISTIGIETTGNEEEKKEETTIKANHKIIEDNSKVKPVKIVNNLE